MEELPELRRLAESTRRYARAERIIRKIENVFLKLDYR
jgi:hypothetical protein